MSRQATALIVAICLVLGAGGVRAQGASVAFGGIKTDTTLPVEVTSDSLDVSQPDGLATFKGNVIVIQGDMRLTAAELEVVYVKGDQRRIEKLHATGGVTLVSPTEAAEAQEAVYTVEAGEVVMTGDVLLTQGTNTLAGQKLVVDLKTGLGQMEGRVKTILNPGGN
ncbi:MAG: lipopolysaccharide transport periplasmic protein LptA [Defluviimonas sp.]|uniref:lipopolysaccharide transport periplasmic protein LptA n=1 Tax=Albidovulum sp. TaxID=1872424 RepID=UPI002A29F87F|nr:lipopolysaccharide transport periplasmic protein LptA [Defluviimonas sp.]